MSDYTKWSNAELNAEYARRQGWTDVKIEPFDPHEIMLATGIPPARGRRIICPKVATDLNEAVKLPGFEQLAVRNNQFYARVCIPQAFSFSEREGFGHLGDEPARAICLAYLAADDAGEVGDGE